MAYGKCSHESALIYAANENHFRSRIASLYSLFRANLGERKRCHLALRPDKSILKVPGNK